MKVTLTVLAEKLNLSPSTVSRALKNDKRISERVRKQVVELANEMGYRPNLLARGLKSDKSYCIGLVINDISWAFFSELSQQIQNAAEQIGYSLLLYSSNNNPQQEKVGIERMAARRCDGLIVFANEDVQNIRLLEDICHKGIPVVLLNNLEDNKLDVVTIDNARGTYLSTKYLVDQGHKRIAYIGPTPKNSVEKERLQGYQTALVEKFGEVDKQQIYVGIAHSLLGYELGTRIVAATDRPTAIVVYNDTMAFGVIRAILEAGLKIPEDISLVGFDGLDLGQSVYPPLTTVSIPLKQIATLATQILVDRIDSDDNEQGRIQTPQHIKLAPELILRKSTGIAL